MIRIGEAYFDDDLRWAMCPSLGYEEDRYMVVLQSGCKVNIKATKEMVQAAMERIGYDPSEDAPLCDLLSDDEYNELMDALEEGCTWMAKDIRGICCAFTEEPEKAGAYFQDPTGGPFKRLQFEYNFLMEGEKIDIQDIFRPGCNISGGGTTDES